MAATKRNAMLIEEARQKIQTTQLINRLQNHGLGKLKKEMTTSQVRACEILLAKSVPDLSAITMGMNVGLQVSFVLSNAPGQTIDSTPRLQITGAEDAD